MHNWGEKIPALDVKLWVVTSIERGGGSQWSAEQRGRWLHLTSSRRFGAWGGELEPCGSYTPQGGEMLGVEGRQQMAGSRKHNKAQMAAMATRREARRGRRRHGGGDTAGGGMPMVADDGGWSVTAAHIGWRGDGWRLGHESSFPPKAGNFRVGCCCPRILGKSISNSSRICKITTV